MNSFLYLLAEEADVAQETTSAPWYDNLWLVMLVAAGILMAVGLVMAILIVVAEKVFHVEEDTRIADVEKLLPNFNCGACGHAGCHDMATAIVEGKQEHLSDCKPGNKAKNYDPIIEYMKAHPDKDGTLHVPKI
jgi:electron transport complex protein RnfB